MAGAEAPAIHKRLRQAIQAPAAVPLLRPFAVFEAATFGADTGAGVALAAAFVARLAFTGAADSAAFIVGAGCAFAERRGLAALAGAGAGSGATGADLAARFEAATLFGAAAGAFGSGAATDFDLPRVLDVGAGAGSAAGVAFLDATAFFGAGTGVGSRVLLLLLAALTGAAFSGAAFAALVFSALGFTELALAALGFAGLAFFAAPLEAGGFAAAAGAGSAMAGLAADFLAAFGAAAPLLADFDDARTAIACARRVTGVSSAIHSTPFT